MEKDTINKYILNFRRSLAPYLKEDVSIKAIVYPHKYGAIIVFKMDFNASNNTEYKSDSETIQEAMRKSNLFDSPDDANDIQSKVIWTQNLIIIIKNNEEEFWTNEYANRDVSNLVKSIEEVQDGRK